MLSPKPREHHVITEIKTSCFCRAEQAVRMSAQNAIDEAEKRARLAREEHEKSTKELDEQLAEARVCGHDTWRFWLFSASFPRETQINVVYSRLSSK